MSDRRGTEDFLSSETEVLVNRTRRYRKLALRALVSVAVLAAVSMAFFYLAVHSSEPEVAQHYPMGHVRENVDSPTLDELGGADTAGATKSADAVEADTESKAEAPKDPKPAGPGTVMVLLSRRGTLWLGNNKEGVGRRFELKLDPGKHLLKAKMGRKAVLHRMTVEAGGSYKLQFNHRRKRAKAERVEK